MTSLGFRNHCYSIYEIAMIIVVIVARVTKENKKSECWLIREKKSKISQTFVVALCVSIDTPSHTHTHTHYSHCRLLNFVNHWHWHHLISNWMPHSNGFTSEWFLIMIARGIISIWYVHNISRAVGNHASHSYQPTHQNAVLAVIIRHPNDETTTDGLIYLCAWYVPINMFSM